MTRLLALSGWLAFGVLLAAVLISPASGQAERSQYIILYDDGSWQYAPVPGGTPTPEDEPTLTLPPSPTALPTNTPRQTGTATPTPTATPQGCYGTVTADRLNVRSGPGTSYPVVTQPVQRGDVLQLEGYSYDAAGGKWYRIFDGWVSAVYVSTTCAVPIVPQTAWGVWAGPGADRGELVRFGDQMRAAGRQPAVTVYGDYETATLLYGLGWVVAWRPFIGDCPVFSDSARFNARAWWQRARAASTAARYTWLVVSNECVFPSAEYARDWIDEIVWQAEQAGEPRIVPVVWSPGRPAFEDMPVLRAAYDSSSVTVALGLNLYPARVNTPLDLLDAYASYTTYRPLHYLDRWGVPVVVTEFARSDGSDPPVWAEYAGFVRRYEGRVIMATAWYTAGEAGLGHWPLANLRGKLGALAGALIGNNSQKS